MFGGNNVYIEDAILRSGQVVRNGRGWATHRIQPSVLGDKLVITEIGY